MQLGPVCHFHVELWRKALGLLGRGLTVCPGKRCLDAGCRCVGLAHGASGDLMVLKYPGSGQCAAAAARNVSEDRTGAPGFGYCWRGRPGWVRIPGVGLI